MDRWRRCAFTACLLLASLPAFALDPAKTITQYDHTFWASKDGAPAFAMVVVQTPDGSLWWGTDDGLYRFDGVQFDPIRSLDGHPIPRQVMSGVMRAPGGFWLDFGQQNYRYQNGHLQEWGHAHGWPQDARDVVVEDSGVTWVATELRQLWRIDQGTRTLVGKEWSYPFKNLSSLTLGRDGTLWVANAEDAGGVAYLPPGEKTFRQLTSDVSDVGIGKDGSLWLSSINGIRVVDFISGRPAKSTWITHGKCGGGLLFDRDGGLWVGCFDGLSHAGKPRELLLPGGESRLKAETIPSNTGLNGSVIMTLTEDRDGNIWTAGTGIHRFRDTTMLQVIARESGEPPAHLVAGPEGSVWGTSFNEGLLRIEGSQVTEMHTQATRMEILHYSPSGELWAAGVGGVWRRDAQGHFDRIPLANDMAIASVDAIAMGPDNAMWFAFIGGVARYQERRWSQPGATEGFPEGWSALSAVADERGRLWFGGRENDLLRVEQGRGRLIPSAESGLAVGQVRLLYRQGAHLWASGPDGVALYDGSRFHDLTDEAGKPFQGVTGIAETRSGELWLHGESAAWRISAAELSRSLPHLDRGVHAKRYDATDGLRGVSPMINPRSSVIEATDGRLWFSTSAGVATWDPTVPEPIPALLSTTLRSLMVDEREIPLAHDITLPVTANRMLIEYAAPNTNRPERIRYRYRLDGVDSKWVDARGQRTAVYTKLAPGTYRFHVMAKLEEGSWGEEARPLTLVAPPPWFQTAWFRALVGLVVLACAWTTYRLRIARISADVRLRLTAQQSERERIARELHDTLLQGVHAAILNLQAATDRMHQGEPARAHMSGALDAADRTLADSRDRIMGLRQHRPDHLDVHDSIETLGRHRAGTGATAFALCISGTARELREECREELYSIAAEAMRNAFRHAHASRVDVTITYESAQLIVDICDDGTGLPVEFRAGGRPGHGGIRGMHERVRILGGKLTLDEGRSRGTRVLLHIAATAAYTRPPRWTRFLFPR